MWDCVDQIFIFSHKTFKPPHFLPGSQQQALHMPTSSELFSPLPCISRGVEGTISATAMAECEQSFAIFAIVIDLTLHWAPFNHRACVLLSLDTCLSHAVRSKTWLGQDTEILAVA